MKQADMNGLQRYKKEVLEMSYLEFDEEEFSEMLREEGRKEGREEEHKEYSARKRTCRCC